MIKMCDEMKKLRDFLSAKNVEWYDKSDGLMCRTKFDFDGRHCSVIHGVGSYGGIDVFCEKDGGLLECRINSDEPECYLTADDVIAYTGVYQRIGMVEEEIEYLGRLIDASTNGSGIRESNSEDSEYDFYVDWDYYGGDWKKECLEDICCRLFIGQNGSTNFENIYKFRKVSGFNVVQGDGDSNGWLTGVITDPEGTTMYYCFG